MTWFDAVIELQHRDPRALARLMAAMWQQASEAADEATLANLEMNAYDPYGLATALQWRGLTPSPEVLERVLPSGSMRLPRFIPFSQI
jgi:hypothetical protein